MCASWDQSRPRSYEGSPGRTRSRRKGLSNVRRDWRVRPVRPVGGGRWTKPAAASDACPGVTGSDAPTSTVTSGDHTPAPPVGVTSDRDDPPAALRLAPYRNDPPAALSVTSDRHDPSAAFGFASRRHPIPVAIGVASDGHQLTASFGVASDRHRDATPIQLDAASQRRAFSARYSRDRARFNAGSDISASRAGDPGDLVSGNAARRHGPDRERGHP